MKIFRITSSEIKKILTRSSLYVMGLFLVVLLVFTAIIFNPKPSGNVSKSYNALNIYGNTTSEIISNFNTAKNGYSDARVSDMGSVINFYATNPLDFSEIYSTDSNKSTEMQNLFSAYIAYSTVDGDDFSKYNLEKQNLEKAFSKFKVEFERFTTATYPIIRLSTKTKATIDNLFVLLNNHILSQDIVTIEGHKALIKTLNDSKAFYNLQRELAKIEKIDLSGDFLNELSTLNTNINLKLIELEASITKSESVDEARKSCAQYVSVKTMGERLVGNSLYLELVKGKSDNEVNNLYVLKNNPFINDSQEVFFKNYITEQLAIDNYLYKNNAYDFNYNKNFSKYGLMAGEASAFDYAFYAMELISFFIIMCACIIASTSIAGEYTSGTIKMLAVRPYKRSKIITSKFLATLVLTILLLLLTSIIVIITGVILYGANLAPILAVFNGTAAFTINPILMFLIYFITILIKAIVFISIAMMFSVIFKNVTPAIIVSLITFFIAPIFTSFVPLVPALTYLPLINIDLFKFFGNQYISSFASKNSFVQIFTSQNFLSSNVFITLALVLISIGICLTTTYLLFKKRDI